MRKNRIMNLLLVAHLAFSAHALAEPIPAVDSEFTAALDQYLTASQNNQRVQKVVGISKIKRMVFDSESADLYLARLREIDRQASKSPEAVYDLAKSLQLHWESKFSFGMVSSMDGLAPMNFADGPDVKSERPSKHLEEGSKIGAVIGYVALGATMLKNPANAPRYFRLARHLLPLMGMAGGGAVAHGIFEFQKANNAIPASPAEVMNLGLASEAYDGEDYVMARDLISLTASTAAAGIAYDLLKVVQAARVLNAAATPLKVHPAALIGSIVLGVAVEQGAVRAIDWYEYSRLVKAMNKAEAEMQAAVRDGDELAMLSSTERFVTATTQVCAYLNIPIKEASLELADDLNDAALDYGSGTPAFNREVERVSRRYFERIREFTQERAFMAGNTLEDQRIRRALQAGDLGSIEALGPAAIHKSEDLRAAFERFVANSENGSQMSLSGKSKEMLFGEYLSGLRAAQDRRLIRRFREKEGKERDALLLLLEANALIRATGSELLSDSADSLDALIERNEMMTTVLPTGGVLP